MKKYSKIKFIIILLILILNFVYLLNTNSVSAQQLPNHQVIISWQANNFYPSNYLGKPYITPYTPVLISAEVIKDKKLLDISQAYFTWYINNKIVKKGVGFKEILLNLDTNTEDSLFLRVIIQINDSSFESSIRIPIHKPLIVIENSYPLKLIKGGEQNVITAIPYFFNIQSLYNLEFSWLINNQQYNKGVNQNQFLLKVNQPDIWTQDVFFVDLIVKNIVNPLEFIKERFKVKVSS